MSMAFRLSSKTLAGAILAGSVFLANCGEKTEKETPPSHPSATQPGKGARTIVYIGYSSSNKFWNTVKAGAAKTSRELGVELQDLTTVDPTPIEQKNAIDNAVLKRVDGLILGAIDPRALRGSLDKAYAAGIPVIAIAEYLDDHPAVRSRIYTDELYGAGLAGRYIVERLGGKGKVLILGGKVGSPAAEHRRKGVADPCEEAGMEALFRPADWVEENANEITQNELDRDPSIDAIFAACDPMILAAKQVAKHKGLLDRMVLVGYDGIPECLQAIQKGEVEATIRQDPARMGRESVELMARLLEGEAVPEMTTIKPILVTKENVDQYLGGE
jgi:ABC-type sugar transport system substrate-binding protein